MKCRIIILTVAMLATLSSAARESARWGISTNAVDWACLLTANASGQFAVSRHFTLEAQARWNPWTFNKSSENQLQSRQRCFSLGARWWPWYAYSGWWVAARGQYREYNFGGLGTMETEEGDAAGLVLSAGFSLQVKKWLNIDFGAGFWGGYKNYVTYACPSCGRRTDQGGKGFVLPDELLISAMFIF